MNRQETGFGIIGCGSIANWHAGAIARIAGTRLVAVTDLSEKSRSDFARKYAVEPAESVEKLLSRADVDIVCICTPSGLHAPLAVQALAAGKHVIVEKPMALSLPEADAVIRASEQNQVKVAVISQLRFTPAMVKLKEAVDRGLLGRLVTGDIYMKFYRSPDYYQAGGWRGTWKMDGGGALMNQGIHGVDLLRYVMGPVRSIHGYARTLARPIEVEDTAVAALEFQNGALGIIEATTSIYPGRPRRLEISGDRGTIILEEDSIIAWDIAGLPLPADVTLGRTLSGAANDPTAMSLDGHVLQISDMVEAVRNGREPLVNARAGRLPVEIILAIYESSRTGKQIYLER